MKDVTRGESPRETARETAVNISRAGYLVLGRPLSGWLEFFLVLVAQLLSLHRFDIRMFPHCMRIDPKEL